MTTFPPPTTPTVAIARVLRGLGLTQGQGKDFRVDGEYRNGERIGTYVLSLTRHADETIAAHADDIERLAGATGYAFRVSVRYCDRGRPMTTVANYGRRVRETPPAQAAIEEPPIAEPEPAPAVGPTSEPTAAAGPPAGSTAARFLKGAHERAWGRQRAQALGWSERQAYLVASAATAGLSYDSEGVLRDRPRPGWPGKPIDEGRLGPLIKAGFLVVTEPYGPGSTRISATADGVEALRLWRVYRPAPAAKDRKEEREPLKPLIGGEYAARRDQAAAEDYRRRNAEREAMYAAFEELHAWEARDEARWKAWATVQGITHRLGRRVPAGWVPTAEEIERHRLDPDVVADLRAEAARPTPKPEIPAGTRARPLDLPPLPAVPDEMEQLRAF